MIRVPNSPDDWLMYKTHNCTKWQGIKSIVLLVLVADLVKFMWNHGVTNRNLWTRPLYRYSKLISVIFCKHIFTLYGLFASWMRSHKNIQIDRNRREMKSISRKQAETNWSWKCRCQLFEIYFRINFFLAFILIS